MRLLVLFLHLLFLPFLLGATPTRSLHQAWERLQAHSPLLASLQAQLESSQAQLEQTARWLPSNPELQMQYGTQALSGRPQDQSFQLQLGQVFEIAGQPALRHQQAHFEKQSQYWELQKERLLLKRKLEYLWLDLGGLQALYQTQNQTLKILAGLDQASQARYQSGDISRLEREIFQLSLRQEHQLQSRRSFEIQGLQQSLANLLQDQGFAYQIAFSAQYLPQTWRLENLEQMALKQRPDYQGLLQKLAKAEIALDLAEKLNIPDLRFFLGWNASRGTMGPDDFLGDPGGLTGILEDEQTLQMGVSTSLPMLSRSPEVKQARAELSKLQALLKNQEQIIRAEVRQAWTEYHMYLDLERTSTQLLHTLNQQANLLMAAYQRGEVSLERQLLSQEKWLRSQENYWQYQIATQKSRVDLETALGQLLIGEHHEQ